MIPVILVIGAIICFAALATHGDHELKQQDDGLPLDSIPQPKTLTDDTPDTSLPLEANPAPMSANRMPPKLTVTFDGTPHRSRSKSPSSRR